MKAQLSRERLENFINLPLGNGLTRSEQLDLVRFALAAMDSEPVSMPDEQHSERFDWSYEDWVNHLGGRHQNNDPACYYEFGSFMAVAEMLRQFGNVQRKVGWNAYRAAMQAEPVTAATVPDGWIAEAKKLAEIYGTSFVVFRNGEEPECADPSKVIISFTDAGLGYPAAPEQEV